MMVHEHQEYDPEAPEYDPDETAAARRDIENSPKLGGSLSGSAAAAAAAESTEPRKAGGEHGIQCAICLVERQDRQPRFPFLLGRKRSFSNEYRCRWRSATYLTPFVSLAKCASHIQTAFYIQTLFLYSNRGSRCKPHSHLIHKGLSRDGRSWPGRQASWLCLCFLSPRCRL